MTDVGVFPTLQGQGWSVSKTPIFQTRIQRAVSGRELRALDYPYPLWQYTLVFNILRDNTTVGLNELRTLMGFFMLCQGAYGTFLFTDPNDNTVTGQILPAASSTLATFSLNNNVFNTGSNYSVGDQLSFVGGTLSAISGAPTIILVTNVNSGGGILGASLINPGLYAIVPANGLTPIASTGGTGTGAQWFNTTWLTQTQLVRTLGDPSLPGGGFTETITAPNLSTHLFNIYFNGVIQTGYSVNILNGVITLPTPFVSSQPAITADFTYYFRCRFVDDSYEFTNFLFQLWELKKLTFISVR